MDFVDRMLIDRIEGVVIRATEHSVGSGPANGVVGATVGKYGVVAGPTVFHVVTPVAKDKISAFATEETVLKLSTTDPIVAALAGDLIVA